MGHPMPHSIISLDVSSKEVKAELKLPLNELQLAVPFDVTTNANSLLERSENELKEYILSHIQLKDEFGKLWNIQVKDFKLSEDKQTATGKYQELTAYLLLTPPAGSDLRKFVLEYDAIIHQVVTHKIFVTLKKDWKSGKIENDETPIGIIELDIANNRVNPINIQLENGSTWKGFKSMVSLGMHHISEGTDHLMFLLVLLLPATLLIDNKRWSTSKGTRKSIIQLLKIITAFTIGHSLTLILGSLQLVNFPSQPIEILIALTIVITAIHALRPIFPSKEILIASSFGLIHGLAFSSILSEMNLGRTEMVYSILGFNIGIEIMQLFVVLLVIPWLIILSKYKIYKWVRIAGAIVCVIAALGWLIERITYQPNFISTTVEDLAHYGKYLVLFLATLALLTSILMKKKEKAAHNNLIIFILIVFISCNNKEKTNELKEKELNLRKRELNLKEQELQLKNDTLINEFSKNNDVEKISEQKKPIPTPELLFEEWEINLKKKGIFDYVTKKDCENLDRMMNLYDKGKYPMHTESKSIIPFDFNNDKVKDYLINYSLQNCVQGNGWGTDFIFFTSQNGSLSVNELLTNKLKTKIKNYVTKNYGSDVYVRVENNYTIVQSFKINQISNNICYGDFDLMQDGASCCPEISGNFEYNINENSFSVFNLKNNKY
ncbi:MAG: HupE/UreJ family protein [Chitinophagales bacterium]|nr:HupE/UreJ family protein [Bacteroidota bacterium]MCB9044156.1 HupE/UreJ family protein [Chitinophagales bacterium]